MNQDFEKELRRAEREKEQARRVESFWDAFRLTENGHVKSTLLLNSFCLSILFLAVYGAAFFLLTDPIHAWLALAPRAVENLVSALLPALIGTAICALTHLICHPQTVLAASDFLPSRILHQDGSQDSHRPRRRRVLHGQLHLCIRVQGGWLR